MQKTEFDVGIAGGGLAGLSAAIGLSKKGHSVVLFEKETYPFHKVCGEYVSMESRNFLVSCGLPFHELHLPQINSLLLTSPDGNSFTCRLPLGGFGISRFKLDHSLFTIAKQLGVEVYEGSKVTQVKKEGPCFSIRLSSGNSFTTRTCVMAYGKHSNLEHEQDRKTTGLKEKNYIAVKYHVKLEAEANIIQLHNFKDGYCGVSAIENDIFCLCYMTKASNLNECNNNIAEMEEKILGRNPFLKRIFSETKVEKGFPITISQIHFERKPVVRDHKLMTGDAAGMITPLCGNGMSMALHSGKMVAECLSDLLSGRIDPQKMEKKYKYDWETAFSKRLRTGRTLQYFFGKSLVSNFFIGAFRTFPFMAGPVIKMTHGKSF